ncbi:hypothetical protein [Oribacterium sp. FC2011]|uniref:hypothetical protein n=1 Tax=Oribacterium sp. FC2011 TaxID=1408311 RepID=UPI0004E13757|nr:hypothetical protein [Oribacterium sp. FC2011]
MDNTTIFELIEKANSDNKKTLSKEDQRKYVDTLAPCLKENGITDETVYFYVNGIKFGSSFCIVSWNRQFDEKIQAENYDKLLNNKNFKEQDNVAKLRIILSLLIQELCNQKQNDVIVGELLHRLVELSYKKDGTRISNLGAIFRTYFVNNMRYGVILPDIDKYSFSKEYTKELILFLEEAINGVVPKGDNEITNRNNVRNWIKKEKMKIDYLGSETESINEINSTVNNQNIENPKEKSFKNNISHYDVKNVISKKLLGLIEEIEDLDSNLRKAQAESHNKGKEISRLKNDLKKYEDLYKSSTDENTKIRNELEEVKKKNIELEINNKELADRVNRQVNVIDIYDQDKANTKDEIQNQIATGLKKIFEDYKSAENMQMTIDLGENMRDSLDDIFRKLKKMGIDIEGR